MTASAFVSSSAGFRMKRGADATLRELNLLNDHCLDDIGRRRPLDPKTDDLVKRLRAGG